MVLPAMEEKLHCGDGGGGESDMLKDIVIIHQTREQSVRLFHQPLSIAGGVACAMCCLGRPRSGFSRMASESCIFGFSSLVVSWKHAQTGVGGQESEPLHSQWANKQRSDSNTVVNMESATKLKGDKRTLP
jgi:hypothetical protein